MKKLNLPNFNYNIRKNGVNVEIFDLIRKKYVALTPEEWVRQHFIHFLIDHLNYPRSLFRVESGLRYNKLSKRSDILVFSNVMTPLLLVECKSFKVNINQKGFNQLSVYNTQLNAKYLVLTNGIKHYCCTKCENNEYLFLDTIPGYL